MKILITGAAGFIGSQLAHSYFNQGAELILVDDFSYGSYDNLVFDDCDFRESIIKLDIRDQLGIAEIFKAQEIDYVFNFAGIAPLPDCQIDPMKAIDVNINGFVNILENSRIYGVKKIIQASTNAIYENEDRFPTVEVGFRLPTLIYPNTKYSAERFAESYCRTYGMSVTCLRFSNVYGPHIDCLRKQPPFVGYMIRELYYNRVPVFYSNGTQRRDYIYVDDLIDLAMKVTETTGFDCVNASSNKNYSVNEMYDMACTIMNRKISAAFIDTRSYWGKYPELYEGKFPIKDEILAHEVTKFSLCDNALAKGRYGWYPKVELEEGLRNVIDYASALFARLEQL